MILNDAEKRCTKSIAVKSLTVCIANAVHCRLPPITRLVNVELFFLIFSCSTRKKNESRSKTRSIVHTHFYLVWFGFFFATRTRAGFFCSVAFFTWIWICLESHAFEMLKHYTCVWFSDLIFCVLDFSWCIFQPSRTLSLSRSFFLSPSFIFTKPRCLFYRVFVRCKCKMKFNAHLMPVACSSFRSLCFIPIATVQPQLRPRLLLLLLSKLLIYFLLLYIH